jgi:hypothetical protein
MEQARYFLEIVGLVEAAIFTVTIVAGVFLWARGIGPVLYRLGNGLAKRKIAIFATVDNLTSLMKLLTDSGLFRADNIIAVPIAGDLGSAESASVYVVYWPDWSPHIGEILAKKADKTALVVYQPYDKGRIDDAHMMALDGKRNTAVSNFRGRLLNDIVTSIITTSYETR